MNKPQTQQKQLQESKAALKSQFLDRKSQIATDLFKLFNIFYFIITNSIQHMDQYEHITNLIWIMWQNSR